MVPRMSNKERLLVLYTSYTCSTRFFLFTAFLPSLANSFSKRFADHPCLIAPVCSCPAAVFHACRLSHVGYQGGHCMLCVCVCAGMDTGSNPVPGACVAKDAAGLHRRCSLCNLKPAHHCVQICCAGWLPCSICYSQSVLCHCNS